MGSIHKGAARARVEKRPTSTLAAFDGIMLAVMALLVASIAVVIVRGDQIGLSVQAYSPAAASSSRASIQVTFDNPLQAPVSDSALTLSPPIVGKLAVSGAQITLKPSQPLASGVQYRATLHAGIRATTGQELKHDVQWSFRVSPPRILYLGPTDNIVQNLYLIDPAQPGQTKQLTFSQTGLQGYDIAQDGSLAVYAELRADGTSSLSVLDLTTFATRPLYPCKDSICTNPAISPDGNTLAFEQANMNSGLNVGIGPPRVFLMDVPSQKVTPLFSDTQQLSYAPQWSPDGKLLMVFDSTDGGIVLHDAATGKNRSVQAIEGDIGTFSPDGKWFIYPTLSQQSSSHYVTHIALVDLTSPSLDQRSLEADKDADDDQSPVWSMDSLHIFFLRNTPSQPQPGLPQVAMMDITSGQVTTLVQDENYRENTIAPSPSGDVLLLQRFPVNNPAGHTEFWTYDLATRQLKQIGENGLYTRWIP